MVTHFCGMDGHTRGPWGLVTPTPGLTNTTQTLRLRRSGRGLLAPTSRSLVRDGRQATHRQPTWPLASPCSATGIGEGTTVRKAIVDKNARVGMNCRLLNREGVIESMDRCACRGTAAPSAPATTHLSMIQSWLGANRVSRARLAQTAATRCPAESQRVFASETASLSSANRRSCQMGQRSDGGCVHQSPGHSSQVFLIS
jgi:hypothetical protein